MVSPWSLLAARTDVAEAMAENDEREDILIGERDCRCDVIMCLQW